MRIVNLSKQGSIKASTGEKLLYIKDFEDLSKSHIPGEWVIFKGRDSFLGYVNPLVAKGALGRIVSLLPDDIQEADQESEVAIQNILKNIKTSVEYRLKFKDLASGCRLIYGDEDNLPGLIVDKYENCTLVQINTAGIDRFRENIEKELSKYVDNVLFLDDKKYRANEILPEHENIKDLPENVLVSENGIYYELSRDIIQKIGYYYDHRDNRRKLEKSISRLDMNFEKGADLFSYVGSWGLHALRGGVKHIDFVDQANMESVTLRNLELNEFSGRGEFHHKDVFKFLEECTEETYDLVISDPPAFAKDEKGKKQALRGYDKLHGKVFPILKSNSVFVAASCTHYVSLEELDSSVSRAAKKNNSQIRILDLGVQGPDHPFSSLSSKANYIKYILYSVEKEVQDERATT